MAVSSPGISAPPDVVVGEADGHVNLRVSLNAPGTSTVTVNYTTADVTAVGSNPNPTPCPTYAYMVASGTLTFTPGVTSQVVSVTINNCHLSIASGFQTFTLNLSGNSLDSTITRAITQVDITGDNDTGATPALYVRDAVVDNRAGTVSVPVLLGGPSGLASTSTVTVAYATHSGSAIGGADFTNTSGTLTFTPGETAQNITVRIIDRAGSAPARSFTVTLGTPSHATIADGTGVVTIGASGAPAVSSPGISAPPDVVVGAADGYIDLPVTLSAPGTSSVTVNYTTADVTAVGSNPNSAPCPTYAYMVASGTLTFTPGVTTQVVRVDLNNCGLSVASGFQSFRLNLSASSVDSTITRAITEVDITGDNDTGKTPALYVRDAVVDNRAGTVSVPVILGGPSGVASASTVTVPYSTHSASAIGGTDFTNTSGTLTFTPGETAQNITVRIIDRPGSAPARSFTVTLGTPVHATIADGTGVVTIGASGAPAASSPGISAPPDVVVGATDGYIDLPVTLSAPGTSTVTVNYTTVDGTAFGSNPNSAPCPTYAYMVASGTLTFTPGVRTQVVRVDINNCELATPGTFTLNLSGNSLDSTIARAITTITIAKVARAPGAPKGVTAVAGNGRAVVSFTAPATNGGAAIELYMVTASPGGVTVWGGSSPITVNGLKNGTTYTFTVAAINANGTGAASLHSRAVTVGAPLTMAAPTVMPGSHQVSLKWKAPASNGFAIKGYVVIAYVAGVAKITRTFHSTATSETFTGLTNGTKYTFTVAAINVNGTGPPSPQSKAVTPSGSEHLRG